MPKAEETSIQQTTLEEKSRDSLGLTLEDWILALLAYGRGVIRGVTRLQKALFILDRLEEKYGVDFVPANFEPREYGPYSREVAQALDKLKNQGLVKVKYEDSGLEEPTVIIEASEEALSRGKKVLKKLERFNSWDDVETRMSFALGAPLLELLWYVYDLWPEYTENSLIRRRLRFWKRRKLRERLFPRILRYHFFILFYVFATFSFYFV